MTTRNRCDLSSMRVSTAEAYRAAITHNPLNQPLRPGLLLDIGSDESSEPEDEPSGDMQMELATVHYKRWKAEHPIHVRFLNGSREDHRVIAEEAVKWERHANVFFVFDNSPNAELRIRLKPGGANNSTVGTDALAVPQSQETMNLGVWGKTDKGGTVLHEFGHALGFFHEHQSPKAHFDWNKAAVYADMASRGWTKSTTDFNIFRRISRGVYASDHDRQSIMHYEIPATWLNSGTAVPDAIHLSLKDKEHARILYPSAGARSLSLDGDEVEGTLNEDGSEELFRFEVSEGGSYALRIAGLVDGAAGVFGPNDDGVAVSPIFEGDTEEVLELEPGNYLLRAEIGPVVKPSTQPCTFSLRPASEMKSEAVQAFRTPAKKTIRMFEGSRLTVRVGAQFDDEPTIVFGEPLSGDVSELSPRPKPGQEVDLTRHLGVGRTVIRLRTINLRGPWHGSYRVLINGEEIDGSPFSARGDDGIFQMAHSMVDLVVLMRPPF